MNTLSGINTWLNMANNGITKQWHTHTRTSYHKNNPVRAKWEMQAR